MHKKLSLIAEKLSSSKMALPAALRVSIVAQLELAKVFVLAPSADTLSELIRVRYDDTSITRVCPVDKTLPTELALKELQWYCLYREYYRA